MKTRKIVGVSLIVVTGLYILYHAIFKLMANPSDYVHLGVLVSVLLWWYGDYLAVKK